ncbi:hypothetical protein AD951_04765 [Acetobacter malorum]|uniref:Secreted protein n=1 Tax=Acetobacter malorum TaxID=178901 RepID=A0A149UQ22_9PROT|nr:hypothetical protein [Acetobacter malorum]KXV69856.1 hypothetical protein AD951_04765 [Acetobacter malorum]
MNLLARNAAVRLGACLVAGVLCSTSAYAQDAASQQSAPSAPAPDAPQGAQNAVHYERPQSHTDQYAAPDPNAQPMELRTQDLERRVAELQQEMGEVEQRLRDVINVLNNVTTNNAGRH